MLQSPEYRAIGGENLSPWSKRVTSRVERLMRFEGDQILPGDELPPDNAGGLLLNAMNVEPEAEAEFNEWYNNEHIPALAAVPGVLCARRFRATSANRRYVALYHLASPEVQATPAWKNAADSEWTAGCGRISAITCASSAANTSAAADRRLYRPADRAAPN